MSINESKLDLVGLQWSIDAWRCASCVRPMKEIEKKLNQFLCAPRGFCLSYTRILFAEEKEGVRKKESVREREREREK